MARASECLVWEAERRTIGGRARFGKKLINILYFEFKVSLKHLNNTRSSEERSELKMDFGVIGIWVTV